MLAKPLPPNHNKPMTVKNHSSVEKNTNADNRLTRVETELESLALSMDRLSGLVGTLARDTATQIQALTVAVTTAAGPRKTDWSVVLTGVGLVLAIGAAAFSPMLMQINSNKLETDTMWRTFSEHQKLELHPVGASKVENLERTALLLSQENKDAILALGTKLQKETELAAEGVKERVNSQTRELKELDTRLQREFLAAQQGIKESALTLQAQMDRRFERAELWQDKQIQMDLEELQKRRLSDDRRSENGK